MPASYSKHQMPLIHIAYQPPNHGWLALTLTLDGTVINIDASDVPNNPLQELLAALEGIACGIDASVWWHMEPASYFMYFQRVADEMQLRLEYADEGKRSRAKEVVTVQGSMARIVTPFWRFLREFQSHAFAEPHWPDVNYERIHASKLLLDACDEI